MSRLASQVENIRMKQIRFATIWGGNSLLTMILDCIKDLLEISTEWHWDFVVNLSESDFPLFPIEEFEGFLFVNRYRNFLESHNDSGQQYFERQGLDWFFYECDNHLWKMGKRKFPENIRLDGNSDWFALNREFLQYVTFGDDSLVQGLKVYFEYAVFPAESFFQTLLINSKFCNSYTGINLKLVNWQNGRGCGCRETVDWCGCSPLAFRLEAIAQLNFTKLRQEHNYFARKFDPVVDRGSIDWVERNFGNKKHDDHQNEKVIFSSDYWFSDYDYLDKSPSTPAAKILLTKCLTAMALQQYFEKDGVRIFFQRYQFAVGNNILKVDISSHFEQMCCFFPLKTYS